MSVLINMEMPTSCYDCSFSVEAYEGAGVYSCVVTDNCVCKGAGRHDDCPLVPVPPHGRLIDADALVNDMANMIPWAIDSPEEIAMVDGLSAGYEAVKAAPTIIPAEETNKEATNDQNNS